MNGGRRWAALLGFSLMGAHCPPTPTPPSPATVGCPAVPAGATTTTATFTVAATRQLRRDLGFLGCAEDSWPASPPSGLVRVASATNGCGWKDEMSAHVLLNLAPVMTAVSALGPKANGACRILSAKLVLQRTALEHSVALSAGESPICVGQVLQATNTAWTSLPLEDRWDNQFLNATSVILDPSTPVLPIHSPGRPGEPVPAPTWNVAGQGLGIDLLGAMRGWVERGVPNDGIVLKPQDVLTALPAATRPGASGVFCMWDLAFDSATVTIDTGP